MTSSFVGCSCSGGGVSSSDPAGLAALGNVGGMCSRAVTSEGLTACVGDVLKPFAAAGTAAVASASLAAERDRRGGMVEVVRRVESGRVAMIRTMGDRLKGRISIRRYEEVDPVSEPQNAAALCQSDGLIVEPVLGV